MKKLFFLFCMFLFIPNILAVEDVYLFHSSSCGHCKAEIEYLNSLDDIEVHYYEVLENYDLFDEVRNKLSIDEASVPLTIIGSDYTLGFSDDIKTQINDMIESYKDKDYCNAVEYIINEQDISECLKINENIYTESEEKTLNIFGKKFNFNMKDVSLPLISFLIGFIDGFNPCAMWVLVFLISMLFNMKDRKKMWILGLTFLGVSALVYLIFMSGILVIANSKIGLYFKYIISLVAIIGGLINLKSFFTSLKKNVGCQVTDKNKRNKIINKIKSIVFEKNLFISLVGISMLAISVNFIELACSAGLPSIFIEILSLNKLNIFMYIIYMLIYIIAFMIDDIVVFVIAMTTLKVIGISNKYTKYSHLIGGIIMILIGILMIFKTDWLMFNF